MSTYGDDFQEIGHCGGQFTVNVTTSENGRPAVQLGVRHTRPTPASWIAVYVLPPGIPVAMIQLAGIGAPWSPPPAPGCLPLFVASDSLGMFGHRCPRCKGYWRSEGPAARWKTTCAYCGFRADGHAFLTEGQRKYLQACCDLVQKATQSEQDGEHVIDMDQIADAVGKDSPKPDFYYAEQSQQKKFRCSACGHFNDILGRYGYCSGCGSHNGLQELEADVGRVRDRIKTSDSYEACVKEAVSAFDSYARHIAKQLAARIPMTLARRKQWERKLFHNLKSCAEELRAVFDIPILKHLSSEDIEIAALMFHRRHVYEHNGGEADEKYISDSGDTSVRPKQVLRESRDSALRIAELVGRMGQNLHEGFHELFPPEEEPIRLYEKTAQQRGPRRPR